MPDLAELLTRNAALFTSYEHFSNAQTMLQAGSIDDPDSFNEYGGKTGSLGYYPVVNVNGQVTYQPSLARLKELARAGSMGLVSLAQFGIANDGSDVTTRVQDAIVSAYSAGARGLLVPPGDYGLDRARTLVVPTNFSMVGVRKRSRFLAMGSSFSDMPKFPLVGGAMVALGDPVTRRRYGNELSRLPTGSGATFNLTVSGGRVTAAQIANGGTGFRVGDITDIGNGAQITVTGTSGTPKGAITALTVSKGGSGWGAPNNPVAQTDATGRSPRDRVFDPNSFAAGVVFKDLVFDGTWGAGNASLTGMQIYNAIDIRGALDAVVEGCEFYRLPNTGVYLFDSKRAKVIDNYAENCGWTGVFGGSRNGFTNAGLYTLMHPELNTDAWLFAHNRMVDIADVGSQFSAVENFDVSHNQYMGCGTIAIEGESAGFKIWDTYASNGGVRVPGSGTVSNNSIDGLMMPGRLATDRTDAPNYVSIYAYQGISWAQGNEGRIAITDNPIRNLSGCAIKARQVSSGDIEVHRNKIGNINLGSRTVTPGRAGDNGPMPIGADASARGAVIETTSTDISIRWNEIDFYTGGPGIFHNVNSGGVRRLEISDNRIANNTSGGGTTAAILVGIFRPNNFAEDFLFNRNQFFNIRNECIILQVSDNNALGVRQLSFDDNQFMDGNRADQNKPYIAVRTVNGGVFNALQVTADRNKITESAIDGRLYSTGPLFEFGYTNSYSSALISVSYNRTGQFAAGATTLIPEETRFTIALPNMPAVLARDGNR